ncbi:hypothetical protein [Nocardia arthritidis]|uniref:Uncharacterized protein n=1 Tax=Nocardia arthritidis TaxID=228602 RepID=A0A6G9YU34_9NOCA|nr:hypothetical protein [Nocardia arthritidis]QIS16611.1 hypothetical protein F5544_44040 [Nocardia arthritidis]
MNAPRLVKTLVDVIRGFVIGLRYGHSGLTAGTWAEHDAAAYDRRSNTAARR